MRTIWKFPLGPDQPTIVSVPVDAKVVLVGIDPASGRRAVWIELDDEQTMRDRAFKIHGTGGRISVGWQHVGSLIDGIYVWHIYEARL